jgi:hypothetical protein
MDMLCCKIKMPALLFAVVVFSIFMSASHACAWKTCIAEGSQAIRALLAEGYITQGQQCPPGVPGNMCYRLTTRFRDYRWNGPQVDGDVCGKGTYPAVSCTGYVIGQDVICIIGVDDYGPPQFKARFISDARHVGVTFLRPSATSWQGWWIIKSKHTSGAFVGASRESKIKVTLNPCRFGILGAGTWNCTVSNNRLTTSFQAGGNNVNVILNRHGETISGTFTGHRLSNNQPIGGTYTGRKMENTGQ